MIRWCAYCQRFQGEVAPFDDYAMTHTICERCVASRAYTRKQPASLDAIRSFFGRIAASGLDPLPSAAAVVTEGAALGLDPVDLLLGIIQPVLRQIGERWARSEVTVAEEHRCTALCSEVVQLLVNADPNVTALRQARSPEVLLVAAEGNHHSLGIQILEVVLLRHQVATFTLYPGVPIEEVVRLARTLKPRFIAISAALPPHVAAAQAVAERIAQEPSEARPLVIVGGFAAATIAPPSVPGLLVCRDLDKFMTLVMGEHESASMRMTSGTWPQGLPGGTFSAGH